MRSVPGVVAVVGLLVACGPQSADPGSGPGPTPSSPSGDTVRITARAVAAIADSHLAGVAGAPAFGRSVPGTHLGAGPQAELRYAAEGEHNGDVVTVMVARDTPPEVAECDAAEHCEEYAGGYLVWQPGSAADPGTYSFAQRRDRAWVVGSYRGAAISGDPRDGDLLVPVDVMVDLVGDPALDERTSPEWVRAGQTLTWWTEGRPMSPNPGADR